MNACAIAVGIATVICLTLIPPDEASASLYTPDMIANARRNIERYPWAQGQRDRAINRAKRWVALEDEALWRLVVGQDTPRCIDVTMTRGKRMGCINCGDDVFNFGNYPYKPDCLTMAWKIKCPSCDEIYPKNDFAAFYESALDEQGLFDVDLGDRSLLFNAEHPDPNDPLHEFGVDDGFGYHDDEGFEHRYIGYYGHSGLWVKLLSAARDLSGAYILTGEQIYAHKCAILLNRVADVYPDMDWAPYAERGWFHSDGGSNMGKIQGRIWETGTVSTLAEAYDRIKLGVADDDELFAFLAEKSTTCKLPTPVTDHESFCNHLDDHILREGANAVLNKQAWGNEGMHQSAMARCAIALDQEPETSEWLDWIFTPAGGHVPSVVVGGIDRDGVGAEAGPGYALSWGSNIGKVADLVADYDGYDRHDVYRDFPQFRKTFTAAQRMLVLNYTTPNTGDSGRTGSIGKVQVTPSFILRGFRYTKRPEFAIAAWQANGNSSEGLLGSIYDPEPEELPKEIDAIVAAAGDPSTGSDHMAGYGLASIEIGEGKTGTAAYVYYGRNRGHGHADRLNMGLYAFGVDLMPDLGYPEFATRWPKRAHWTNNTLSHNTVIVNGARQTTNWVGHPHFFKDLPGLKAFEIDGGGVYGVDEYRRMLALIPVGDGGYVLDVFRCVGGDDHLLSFHGHEGEVSSDGLSLVAQDGGTYAGPEVEFGTEIDGPGDAFAWLYDVRRDDSPPASWTLDWSINPGRVPGQEPADVRLRCWFLSQLDDIALAHGDPPQNKGTNPRHLTYALAHRVGENLASNFVSVLEPYAGAPLIESVERMPADDDQSAALRVVLADGTVDYLLTSADPAVEVAVTDGPACAGALGLIRTRDGVVEEATLIAGTRLVLGDFELTCEADAHAGTVIDFDHEMSDKNLIYVDAELPVEGLIGQEIIIDNDRARNAVYRIEAVKVVDGRTAVSVGDVTLVRGFIDGKDYDSGYTYNFEVGATFRIPNHVSATRRDNGTWEILTTCEADLKLPE